jgi:cellulose synthase (UDP-forming)
MEVANKYLYVVEDPKPVRALGVVGVVSTLLLAGGLVNYFNLSVWYWIAFAPITLFFLINRLTRYGLQMFFPGFSIAQHEEFTRDFWMHSKEPSVDIFLPYCGEDLATFESVIRSAFALEYENKKIYVLDDSASPAAKWLAEHLGVTYRSRPNRGEFRKAGNLQYGYDHSDGEFVFVLDADFRATPNALRDTLPYIVSDPTMGILQTPQFFDQSDEVHDRSPIEWGGGNVVEDFYRIDMPSRDVVKAAICVGTSALYRRKAIEECGGTPKVWGTEDVRQGLKVTRAGYEVRYLPVIVSWGESPSDIQGYFRQHNRWCTGSLATVFSSYYTKARLNWAARISYVTNATYYIAEASSLLFSFHLLTLLAFHEDSLSLYNSAYFVPYLAFYHFQTPFYRIYKPRRGTYIAAFSNSFTYAYTLSTMFFKQILPWQPAGVKSAGVSKPFLHTVLIAGCFVAVFLAALMSIVIANPDILLNANAYPSFIWASYSMYWSIQYLITSIQFIAATNTAPVPVLAEAGV